MSEIWKICSKISESGRRPQSALDLSPGNVIEHGKNFLLRDFIDDRDVMHHSIMILSMSYEQRYDEASKIRMDIVLCTSYCSNIGLKEGTNDSIQFQECNFRNGQDLIYQIPAHQYQVVLKTGIN